MKYQKSFFLLFLILISGKNFLYAAGSTCLEKQLALFTVQENDYVYLNFNIGGVPTPSHWHLRHFVTPQRIIDHRISVEEQYVFSFEEKKGQELHFFNKTEVVAKVLREDEKFKIEVDFTNPQFVPLMDIMLEFARRNNPLKNNLRIDIRSRVFKKYLAFKIRDYLIQSPDIRSWLESILTPLTNEYNKGLQAQQELRALFVDETLALISDEAILRSEFRFENEFRPAMAFLLMLQAQEREPKWWYETKIRQNKIELGHIYTSSQVNALINGVVLTNPLLVGLEKTVLDFIMLGYTPSFKPFADRGELEFIKKIR